MEFYDNQECYGGETLIYIVHAMKKKNSNSVNAMCKPFIWHSFFIRYIRCHNAYGRIGIRKQNTIFGLKQWEDM